MRVLVTTTPGRGHYHPMLPLAQAIAARGHDLLWLASEEVCGRLRAQGFDARTAGLAEGATSANMIERFPELLTMAEPERPNFAFSKIFGTPSAADLTTFGTVVEGVRELDVDVLVTLGTGSDPASLGAQPANVDVRDYVPQEGTLARAAAVVSHAGSGTFLAALAHGLPQVAVPQNADQFLNAHAGAKAGVARQIAPGRVTAARVRAELERVLGDPSIADATRRMAQEIAAMPGPGEVAQDLERRYG